MDYSRPELADRLAAEYASGLLRGPARRRFEALLPAHPQLRAAVCAWQDRLMPLTAAVEPQTPSAAVWQRIESRIHGPAETATASASGMVAGAAAWWRGLAFWRSVSALASMAAVAFAVLLARPEPARAPIIVVLAPAAPAEPGAAAQPSFVASISADGRAMVTRPLINVGLQADHSLELWSLSPDKGVAPRSLGVIAADKASVVQRGKVLEGTDAFAVTLEVAGGSADGKPHGPVLYVGKLTL
jgi:anti-sigma-K factor RskA